MYTGVSINRHGNFGVEIIINVLFRKSGVSFFMPVKSRILQEGSSDQSQTDGIIKAQ